MWIEKAFVGAKDEWGRLVDNGKVSDLIEKYPYHDPRAFTAGLYGITQWGTYFLSAKAMFNTITCHTSIL